MSEDPIDDKAQTRGPSVLPLVLVGALLAAASVAVWLRPAKQPTPILLDQRGDDTPVELIHFDHSRLVAHAICLSCCH